MKKTLLAVAILIAVPAIYAQSKPVKVNVDAASDPVSREVADKVAARVGSTSRYALVSTPTEVLVSVSCVTNTNLVNGQELGVTCDTDILYWPVSDVALSITCVGSMATGMSKSDVAQALFESFVRATSDEKLEAKATAFKVYLNYAIRNHPKGVD